jgi:protein TonB
MKQTVSMSAGPAVQLSEFSHHHGPARSDNDRIIAGLLTGAHYVLFALFAWLSWSHGPMPAERAEIIASLLPDAPAKRAIEPLPPFLAHLTKPRAEKPALPVFTIATGAPPQAHAPLAATTQTSSMLGGTSGNGPMGQAASGNGTGGNGSGLAGCIDPVWMRAVTERVRQFFYYPDAALAVHRTGVVMVHFAVRRNGQIEKVAIGKSSGDAELDKAASDIVQKAQPLPPIPDRMHTDRVIGDLPINFGVRSFSGGTSAGSCRG